MEHGFYDFNFVICAIFHRNIHFLLKLLYFGSTARYLSVCKAL